MSKNDMTVEQKQELCKQCQACCKKLSFQVPTVPLVAEFYRARGLAFHYTVDGKCWIDVPHVCPHLTVEGCDIYEKRPYACMVYDGSTHPTVASECLWNKEEKI